MGDILGSIISPRQASAPPRSDPLPKIRTLEEIEIKVKEFERKELIRHMLVDEHDENVEHLMEEVYMVLKMLYGEEVGKEISFFRNNLLEKREIAIEKQKRREQSKWSDIKNFLGGNDDDDNDPPF